jgi:pyruvate/2-oxoglutarate dehydrogenase complex dihydrolipoamide dehydrogenase (E3) component
LCAVGRSANVAGYGLENLGIDLSKARTVEVNEQLQTKFPNIFAAGDVAGPYQFTHTAAHMAWYAAVNALFGRFKSFNVDYRVIPWATFTEPEVARVGLNESDAKQKGIAYEVTTYGIDDLDRAIADSTAHGFVKVLTVPGKDKILGATIVGEHAGDLIAEYVMAMKHGLGMNKILGTIHIYPTLAEANKFAAGNWKRAHQPTELLNWVKKFHAWQRG